MLGAAFRHVLLCPLTLHLYKHQTQVQALRCVTHTHLPDSRLVANVPAVLALTEPVVVHETDARRAPASPIVGAPTDHRQTTATKLKPSQAHVESQFPDQLLVESTSSQGRSTIIMSNTKRLSRQYLAVCVRRCLFLYRFLVALEV